MHRREEDQVLELLKIVTLVPAAACAVIGPLETMSEDQKLATDF